MHTEEGLNSAVKINKTKKDLTGKSINRKINLQHFLWKKKRKATNCVVTASDKWHFQLFRFYCFSFIIFHFWIADKTIWRHYFGTWQMMMFWDDGSVHLVILTFILSENIFVSVAALTTKTNSKQTQHSHDNILQNISLIASYLSRDVYHSNIAGTFCYPLPFNLPSISV